MIMKTLMLLFTAVIMMFMSTACMAKPHQLSWTWPITNCDQSPLDSSDFIESELIYSLVTMPMTSDTEGSCSANRDADAPPGALTVPIPLSDNLVVLNLQPGQTYFARIRVSAFTDGNWSSWSNEAQFTVPYGRPNVIQFTNSLLDRWEYYEIKTSHLTFHKG